MVIGRSDEQQSPPDSMALTTPRDCLALLGGTHLGRRFRAAQTGRTYDRNRIEHHKFPELALASNGPSTPKSGPDVRFQKAAHVCCVVAMAAKPNKLERRPIVPPPQPHKLLD